MGNFEGIGIQFRIVTDTINVIRTIVGGPSEKVGLRAGDRIVMIDDSLVAGVSLDNRDAIKMLKGNRGTKVKVSIYRRGISDLIDFTIVRDVIPTYSVDIAYMVDDSVGYIKISKFSATTYEEFYSALDQLLDAGMKKLMLDLRGNTGGYLQAAIKMSDDFLKEKTLIVYTEGKNRPNSYAHSTRKGRFEENPLVVMIDEGSASASEIVAGAIQDNDRGTIVGRRSFGKGLVQEQLNFPDGSALRLTVSRYHTLTGRNIQRTYENGTEEYYEDFHNRVVNGELENADSIHFDDSLKYYTPAGKVVYGGGGIMPDVYVPLKIDDEYTFYNKLLRKNLIFQYAFDYTDTHRESMDIYTSTTMFFENFKISDEMFNELIDIAKKDKVKGNKKEIRNSELKIKTLLKAFIGRNLLDDEGFYPIYHQIDEGFIAAYSEL